MKQPGLRARGGRPPRAQMLWWAHHRPSGWLLLAVAGVLWALGRGGRADILWGLVLACAATIWAAAVVHARASTCPWCDDGGPEPGGGWWEEADGGPDGGGGLPLPGPVPRVPSYVPEELVAAYSGGAAGRGGAQ